MNYDLLKPFNLEDALNGAELLSRDCETRAKQPLKLAAVCGPDGDYCVRDAAGNLYTAPARLLGMAPLTWVEDKPVYKGDVLYHYYYGKRIIVGIEGDMLRAVKDGELDTAWGLYDINQLYWEPFKVERGGWMNCYSAPIMNTIYPTREEADKFSNERIDCVFITWKENNATI